MALPAWLGGVFKPLTDLVDNLHTSKEEAGQIQLAALQAQLGVASQVLEYEARIVEAQSKIVIAEAQGQSWLQRNWRPMLMTTFGFIVFWNYVCVDLIIWLFTIFSPGTPLPPRLELPGGMWALLTTGVGGYVIGRSGEKMVQTLSASNIDFGGKRRRRRRRGDEEEE